MITRIPVEFTGEEPITVDLTIRDDNNAVIDLTTATVTAEIDRSDGSNLTAWTVTKTDAVNGEVQLTLDASAVSAIAGSTGLLWWDVKTLINGESGYPVTKSPLRYCAPVTG